MVRIKRMRAACFCTFFIFVLVFLWNGNGFCQMSVDKKPSDSFQEVAFFIDFSDYSEGSVESWLREKGFEFEGDAQNRKKLDLDVGDRGLIIEAKKSMIGMVLNESVDLERFSSIKLEWGVIKYPEGASYEKKINNEALMVIIFFGYDKLSSGHFLIPNTPYFIGFFLGKEEQAGKGYAGKYFKKSGRYVCLGNPKPGEIVTSKYDLVAAFKRKYKKDDIPVISGIALAVDTSSSGGGGKAAAFIKSIEFSK